MQESRIYKNLKSNWAFFPLVVVTLTLCKFGSLRFIAKELWVVPAVAAVAVVLFLPHLFSFCTVPRKTRIYCGVLSVGISVLAAWDLYMYLPYGAYFKSVFSGNDALEILLTYMVVVLLGVSMFLTVFVLLVHFPKSCTCRFPENAVHPLKNSKKSMLFLLLYCALTAFVVLTICTKSSFVYPLNDWVDANSFFTVGKSISVGKMLYRDIYEQKGPWLFFLHALCYRISETTFFGVYLLELLAGTVFLYFTAKIMQLYRARGVYILLPLLAAAVYASPAFCHGDSVEELCLPLFSAGFYIAERAFYEKRTVSLRGWIAMGVLGGLAFWMKFNLAGFFVGLALVPLWQTLRRGGFAALLKAVLCILIGVCLPSIPVLVYFGVAGAFRDLWEAYFYTNLFLYATGGAEKLTALAFLKRLLWRVGNNVCRNAWFAVPGFAAVVWYTATAEKGRRAQLLLCALCTLLFVFSGDVAYTYYGFAFAVFAVFAVVALGIFMRRVYEKTTKQPIAFVAAALALCMAGSWAFSTSNNVYLMDYSREELPQYKFAKIINSVENPTLLNYGFLDGGFYTAAGIIPTERYFCLLNINLPEMYAAQNMSVYRQNTDFVVTRNKKLETTDYICVSEATLYFEGVDFTYYLYAAERVLPELSEKGMFDYSAEQS